MRQRGGNGNESGVANANNEFSAKAIVGQIEKERGKPIADLSNDKPAREWGKKAFSNKSTKGFYRALKNWQSQQSSGSHYKRGRSNKKVPALLRKLVKL